MSPAANDLPIGIFDSGVGGLTVLKALRRLLPDEDFVYLGDTARLPYGTKSPASVQRYARHAADFLAADGIKALVVACNTASSLALAELRTHLGPMPVIGVVEPGAAAAVAQSTTGRHLVLATESTTSQRAYTREITRLAPDAKVTEMACSMFVALAEEGWHEGPAARVIAEQYLAGVNAPDGPDTLILGCTHFPLLAPVIQDVVGPELTLVDSASTTAEAVRAALSEPDLLQTAGGQLRLLATDGAGRFARVGSQFLGEAFTAADIEVVDIHPADLGAQGARG